MGSVSPRIALKPISVGTIFAGKSSTSLVNTRNDALADRTPKAFRSFLTLGFTKEN